MKKMKRVWAGILTLALLCGLLTACGGAAPASETPEDEDYTTGDASLDDPRNQDGIGENELLVVSFGTSYNDSRRETIGAVEGALAKLGEEPPEELLVRLRVLGTECLGPDTFLHHVHVHVYGAHREVTFHATLPAATTLAESHAKASLLEDRVKAELGYDATIHVEPHGDTQ